MINTCRQFCYLLPFYTAAYIHVPQYIGELYSYLISKGTIDCRKICYMTSYDHKGLI